MIIIMIHFTSIFSCSFYLFTFALIEQRQNGTFPKHQSPIFKAVQAFESQGHLGSSDVTSTDLQLGTYASENLTWYLSPSLGV